MKASLARKMLVVSGIESNGYENSKESETGCKSSYHFVDHSNDFFATEVGGERGTKNRESWKNKKIQHYREVRIKTIELVRIFE